MRKDKKRILKRVIQVVFSCLVAVAIIGLFTFVTYGRDVPLLDTHGTIAHQERDLILLTFGLGLLVVVPVLAMLFGIAWKYRASNTKAVYQPEFSSHIGLEVLWWGIPCLIIIVLAIITAVSTHALDPYKPLDSKVEPVNVQVVSLEWNWLFIYPDQGVATLNYLNIPEDTPINLSITSDAPMNSFWVPALAGQVYSMTGMSTKLHLMADDPGTYNGSSANISGEGFADMRFKVNSMATSDYESWVLKSANSPKMLTSETYAEIRKPSHDTGEVTYMLMNKDLYNEIIMKYMHSEGTGTKKETESEHTNEHEGHDMSGMDM
ncbi:MAG: ubiquinol oxidase subunit II [Candidatus Microsaccharimonas sp.]